MKHSTEAVKALPIFLFATFAPLLMRQKLDRVNALLSKPIHSTRPSSEKVARTIQLIDRVLRRGRPFVSQGCVTRGLTLYLFLRRIGLEVELVFGAGQIDNRFAAHCWLERDKEPYLEKVDPRQFFVPVYRFEGQHAKQHSLV